MKKILSILLSCILGFAFIGCNSQQKSFDKRQDEMIKELKGDKGEAKELTEGTLFNSLAGTAPNSRIFYILNKDKEINRDQSIVVEMNIDKDDKETEITNFVDKVIKFGKYSEEDLVTMGYSNLLILMYVDGKFVGNSISYIVKDNELDIKDTLIDEKYYDDFQKASKKNVNK